MLRRLSCRRVRAQSTIFFQSVHSHLQEGRGIMDLSRLFGHKQESGPVEKRPDGLDRLPPGQYLTKKWPVLTYEPTPKFNPGAYRFKVWGAVENPFELSWEELLSLPRVQLTSDFHCVTTWSRYDNSCEGVHIHK